MGLDRSSHADPVRIENFLDTIDFAGKLQIDRIFLVIIIYQ